MTEGSQRAIIAAFLANLGIAAAKFVGFAFTGAASMLAEAVHSVADTSNQGLLILGGRRARRPPTPEHPFGYGRERYFWSFVVAVVLFTRGPSSPSSRGRRSCAIPMNWSRSAGPSASSRSASCSRPSPCGRPCGRAHT